MRQGEVGILDIRVALLLLVLAEDPDFLLGFSAWGGQWRPVGAWEVGVWGG